MKLSEHRLEPRSWTGLGNRLTMQSSDTRPNTFSSMGLPPFVAWGHGSGTQEIPGELRSPLFCINTSLGFSCTADTAVQRPAKLDSHEASGGLHSTNHRRGNTP